MTNHMPSLNGPAPRDVRHQTEQLTSGMARRSTTASPTTTSRSPDLARERRVPITLDVPVETVHLPPTN